MVVVVVDFLFFLLTFFCFRLRHARSYPAFVCDMDGVLHRTGVAIDGAREFLIRLRQRKAGQG